MDTTPDGTVSGSSVSTPARRISNSLHVPVDALRSALRRISTGENIATAIPVGSREPSYSNLSVNHNAAIMAGETGQNGSLRRISRIRKSTAKRPEEAQMEIMQRAVQLQSEGLANPAFEADVVDELAQQEEEVNDILADQRDGPVEFYVPDQFDRVTPLPKFPSNRYSGALHPDSAVPLAERDRKISVGFHAKEMPPSVLTYDDDVRPTLEDLRRDPAANEEESVRQTGNERKLKRGNLGWIRGVVLWSILNLWGVMLFLRIGWMAAHAGMGLFLVIVLMGTVIAILTSLSTSAISTNGEVGLGGTYYMISRSLGPQFGAAIGVIFTIANIISVSLNINGFASTVQGLIGEKNLYMVDAPNDVRIISVITLVLLTGFTFFGMEIASKLQLVFFTILSASIANIVIGSIIPPSVELQAQGFVGYSSALFKENFYPAFQNDSNNGPQDFMSVFGVFFPSVTGILAGTSITGDLKDPSGAIPKGTICAILFTSTTYILIGWVTASVTLRHASGSVADMLTYGNLTACHHPTYTECHYGAINDYEIMEKVGHFRPLILAGIFSATLSTALGCINFAPKIFQALCRDNIFPFIHVFGHGYTKNDEPYRAYGLVMIIAVIFLMPADLNFISNIVSNCFLLTYTLVNYATFDAAFSNSPGWRPTFKYYNKWLSLATALACFVIMFCLDWKSAVIAVGIIFVLWLYVYYKDPKVNWGTSAQASTYKSALNGMIKLLRVEEHVKNYRPQVLVLTGLPCVRPALVYFANSITRGTGLLVCGHVLVGENVKDRAIMAEESYKWLKRRKIRAFYDYVAADSIGEGLRALIQTSGLGKLKPNMLLMGLHRNWQEWTELAMDQYMGALNGALDAKLAVALLYAKEGFDLSSAINFEKLVTENAQETSYIEDLKNPDAVPATPLELNPVHDAEVQARVRLADSFESGKKKHIGGEIHVWWLYDDGGLTLLVPHLLSRQSPWDKSKLKIFILAGNDPTVSKTEMKSLLDKFRIEADEVIPVDMDQTPGPESTRWFDILTGRLRETSVVQGRSRKVSGLGAIRESDIRQFSERTLKQIRMRELLLEHSSQSSLNVVTMPLPKKNQSGTFYMASLHTLTHNLPPTLLIRGTQENVLTYYC